jgi:hypothetical protein
MSCYTLQQINGESFMKVPALIFSLVLCFESKGMHYSTADHYRDDRLFSYINPLVVPLLNEQQSRIYKTIISGEIPDDALLRIDLVDLFAKASLMDQITKRNGLIDTRGEDLAENAYKLMGCYVIIHNERFVDNKVAISTLLDQAKSVDQKQLEAFFD